MNATLPPVIPPATQPPVIRPHRRIKARYVVLFAAVLLVGLTARAVAGYFFLGSQTTALRKTVIAHTGGHYEKRFAVHLGWMTTGLVRYGTRLVHLPPEPRAALDTLHQVEVGVYRLAERQCRAKSPHEPPRRACSFLGSPSGSVTASF